MAGKAFVIPTEFAAASGTTTQVKVYLKIAGDGVNPPQFVSGSFVFDAALTSAQNLTNLKAAVVAQCGLNGISLTAADVSAFTAIN